jgi:hypothetical protein
MRRLARECDVFSRYLLGQAPDGYVLEKYLAFHAQQRASLDQGTRAFDRCLTAFARLHPWTTQLADGYARLFLRRGVLRKKLILLLAILESCAPSHELIDAVDAGGWGRILAKLAWRLSVAGAVLVTAVVLFLPWHFLFAVTVKLIRPRRSVADLPVEELGLDDRVLAAGSARRVTARQETEATV